MATIGSGAAAVSQADGAVLLGCREVGRVLILNPNGVSSAQSVRRFIGSEYQPPFRSCGGSFTAESGVARVNFRPTGHGHDITLSQMRAVTRPQQCGDVP